MDMGATGQAGSGWTAGKIVLLVLGLMFAAGVCGIGSCAVLCAGAANKVEEERREGKQQAAAALPWIAQVQDNCRRYEAAPNDIQKSEIFNENEEFIAAQRLDGVRGELSRLSTSQGGATLELAVTVGAATFKTGSLFQTIDRGDPVYEQASQLSKGQCVRLSGRVRDAASVMERSKVCDLDYHLDFESIEACP
jgi:hypothetical protein